MNNSGFSIGGFSEAVFVVNDLNKSLDFYQNVIGWQIVNSTKTKQHGYPLWGLSECVSFESVLIAEDATADQTNTDQANNDEANYSGVKGAIRLIELKGIEQEFVRANSQIWDVGGIFDVNTRVKNIHTLSAKLNEWQWFGANEPVTIAFGPFKVWEWLARSHDGIVHALIERIEPPLIDDAQRAEFSALINASMVVSNHAEEQHFFEEVLGFKLIIHQEDKLPTASSNVFALPFNIAHQHAHVLTLLSADGSRDGTVEIASFPTLKGSDFSDRAKPYNLGISCLRFPVKSLNNLIEKLKLNSVEIENEEIMQLSPYGEVKIIALHSPAGNRLEFFEQISKKNENKQ